ncbi:MAG: DUF6049 family protein [Dermatophilaceae bacterium]
MTARLRPAPSSVCRPRPTLRAAALAGVLGVVMMLVAACVPAPAPDAAAPTAATSAPAATPATTATSSPAVGAAVLRIDSVTPSVVGPDQTATVSGQVVAPSDRSIATATVRAVKSRQPLLTRGDVDTWASGTGTPTGTEIARVGLQATLGPGQTTPFTLVLPAASLALSRSYGAVPIAVQVLTTDGPALGAVRTFVGWTRTVDYVPISLAWVLPVTLDPDPALSSASPATRTAAWQAQVGPGSRLSRLVQATSTAKVAWAIDPAVLGRDTRTPAQVAADPVTSVITPFEDRLRADAGRHTILALPYADPDLAAASDGPLMQDLVRRSASLSSALGTPVQTGVAWPADGALPPGRETALRSAYSQNLTAVLASTELTETGRSLTPTAPAVGVHKTPVVRWDERLSDLASQTTTADSAALVTQQFVAQTAALLGERPGVARTFAVTAPRGLDPNPDALSRLLSTSESLPWVTTIDVMRAVSEAAKAGKPTIDQLSPPATPDPPVLTPAMLDSLEQQQNVITTMSHTLVDSAGFSVQWHDTVDQLTSVRWRKNPAGHAQLLGQVYSATTAVSQGLSITEATTNFLADEGALRVTIVNDLDGAVDGIQLNLVPTNQRIRVVSQPEPVRIEPHSKATVQVRVEAIAAGIVPVNASLTTSDGIAIGQPATLTVRAAPPGAWVYVAAGSVAVLVLIVGLVRGLRRPKTTPPDLRELDLVNPVVETPLEAPVPTHADRSGLVDPQR